MEMWKESVMWGCSCPRLDGVIKQTLYNQPIQKSIYIHIYTYIFALLGVLRKPCQPNIDSRVLHPPGSLIYLRGQKCRLQDCGKYDIHNNM